MATNNVAPPEQVVEQASAEPKSLAVVDNRPHEVQKFELQQRAARLFAASGLFADIRGANQEQAIAQAFVKISLGDSMGFNPAESMTGIDLIQGRVAVGSSLRAARMQRAGYTWDILQLDDKGCRLRLKYKGEHLMCEEIDGRTGETRQVPVVVSFMVEDATRAGLVAKDNYKKNPRNMFFARAITNAQRWFAPGILGVDILSTEEAIFLDPPKDAEQVASGRVKAGTEAKTDRLIDKYVVKGAPQPVVDALNITDKDIELESRVEGEVSEAGPTAQESSAGPQLPLESSTTPAARKRRSHTDVQPPTAQQIFGEGSSVRHRDEG